jgi:alpha-L-fucosidase 2
MLVQSQRGMIHIFPAVPESWKDASFTSLRTEGAFLVSAERSGGVTKRVEITAEKGGTCRLVSPFTGKLLTLTFQPGEQRTLTADP